MNEMRIGARVRVTAGIPSFEGQSGRILQITEPFVRSEHMKAEALRYGFANARDVDHIHC